jgi:hypothetical protein
MKCQTVPAFDELQREALSLFHAVMVASLRCPMNIKLYSFHYIRNVELAQQRLTRIIIVDLYMKAMDLEVRLVPLASSASASYDRGIFSFPLLVTDNELFRILSSLYSPPEG